MKVKRRVRKLRGESKESVKVKEESVKVIEEHERMKAIKAGRGKWKGRNDKECTKVGRGERKRRKRRA